MGEETMKYVPVIERFGRDRSIAMRKLKPRRWFWRARLALRWNMFWIGDCQGWVMTPDAVKKFCDEYRNWMNQNRIEEIK